MTSDDPSATLSAVFKYACGAERHPPDEADLPRRASSTDKLTNRMERFWITQLHEGFRLALPGFEVFSHAHVDDVWGRSEFLHDVTVMTRHTVLSAYHEKQLTVPLRILWQVESELSGDGTKVAYDLGKLTAGSAENKLFVVRLPMDHQKDAADAVKQTILRAAQHCTGSFFLAFVPAYAASHGHLALHWTKAGVALPATLFRRIDYETLREVAWNPLDSK